MKVLPSLQCNIDLGSGADAKIFFQAPAKFLPRARFYRYDSWDLRFCYIYSVFFFFLGGRI